MELVILFDHHFYRTAGKTIYSPTSYSYTFFKERYLSVFDSVTVVARVADVPADKVLDHQPTEGPGVKVFDLGEWTGAWGFLKSRHTIVNAAERFMDRGAAFVMIVPGCVASLAFSHLARRNYPFAVEVVGDPWNSLSPGANSHPLRPMRVRSRRC